MCQVYFESIRVVDGNVLNLDFHQRRVDKTSAIKLADIISTMSLPQDGVHKLRISYTHAAVLHTEISKYVPKRIDTLKVVHDDSIDYSLKSEDRSALNRLYELRDGHDDVLIIKNGMVTDTSFCNILFSDGAKWVTPGTPLLEGTCRARLVQEGKVCVEDISVERLFKYKYYMLVNAMLDFDLQRKKTVDSICPDF